MAAAGASTGPERVGPYAIYGELGSGGMASVHLGQLRSTSGFTRLVAIKRMHAELARSPEFVAMFFQEARIVGRIQHPNVVAALDCVAVDNDAMLVMEYVHGVSLSQLMRSPAAMPLSIASAILVGAALGLHAAHESVDDRGKNLRIVHRDVSPQNILVGVDGLARVLDFGIAKAAECVQHTRTGQVRGKIGYMAPEQLLAVGVDRTADVYSLGVILWEIVTGRRLFPGKGPSLIMSRIANGPVTSPRSVNPKVSPQIAALVMKALSRSPETRYRSALELAEALEAIAPPSSQRVLGEWVAAIGKEELARRSAIRDRVDRLRSGWLEDVSEDKVVTSLARTSNDATSPRTISMVRAAGARSRRLLPWTAAVVVAAVGAASALRWTAVTRRASSVEAPTHATPADVAQPPAHDDWTVPLAWSPTAAAKASNAAPEAPSTAALPAEAPARRGPSHAPVRSRPAPRPKGSPPALSAPAASSTAPSPESELKLIGGRE